MEDVVLLVVGGGPMEGYYRDLTRKRGLSQVVFVGDVQHERVPTFLSIADIALLYLSEDVAANQYRCSLKLREYFAAGVKVLCNDVGELPEFAEYTYQSGSCIHEVTATIVDVLQKGGDGREKRAQRFARDHLQWRGLVENLTKTFGDIAR
jgi:glycosyltransferase involved in cell wall biosynthesis